MEAGIKENEGCADKDSDGDGIVDRLDKCPTEPETKNQFQDDDGCADEVPKAVAQFSGAIAGIVFAPNRTEITAATRPVYSQADLEKILDRKIVDANQTYAAVEAESLLRVYAELGLQARLPDTERAGWERRAAACTQK